MRNTGLDEAQAGIKIAGRNVNNLRYADDATLMAESEEELKSLLTTGRPWLGPGLTVFPTSSWSSHQLQRHLGAGMRTAGSRPRLRNEDPQFNKVPRCFL